MIINKHLKLVLFQHLKVNNNCEGMCTVNYNIVSGAAEVLIIALTSLFPRLISSYDCLPNEKFYKQ